MQRLLFYHRLQVTVQPAPFAKRIYDASPLLTQLFLLIKWRFAHKPDCVLIHASMIRPQSGLWLNC